MTIFKLRTFARFARRAKLPDASLIEAQLATGEAATFTPLAAEALREIREQAHMSQAVFAKHLNLSVGYVSQLDRGAKRPTGATLALLTVIQRKGIEAVLYELSGTIRSKDFFFPARPGTDRATAR